ncbi:hypothetical protein AQJ66_05355 [Streptomyces bungoensis]|uniref:Uncharacterized protein n=1 Tax=Streptomyces bungoensis TaxID=285568 RepID=A0A101TAW1_9ACTN|nr:hypothetical protein AQJ66_05355 [Streptomyces bungoensis]
MCWPGRSTTATGLWLDPSAFRNLDHVFLTLFDDFCDADEPERYLGVSLRSHEEVVLMVDAGDPGPEPPPLLQPPGMTWQAPALRSTR